MSGGLPLAGKRIVITRAPEQAQEWMEALRCLGAEVLMFPLVRFAPPESFGEIDAALSQLSIFDWVFFTSRNAVEFVSQRLAAVKPENPQPCKTQVATVGRATAHSARERGWNVTYTSTNQAGEWLAREMASDGLLAGRKIFLPRSDRADERLPRLLRELGAKITEVMAYRTLPADQIDAKIESCLRAANADAVLFASPSAVQNLTARIGREELVGLSRKIAFVAIGPTTAAAITRAGAQVSVQPDSPDAESLVESLGAHFAGTPGCVSGAASRHS